VPRRDPPVRSDLQHRRGEPRDRKISRAPFPVDAGEVPAAHGLLSHRARRHVDESQRALARGVIDRSALIEDDWTREIVDADFVLIAIPVGGTRPWIAFANWMLGIAKAIKGWH